MAYEAGMNELLVSLMKLRVKTTKSESWGTTENRHDLNMKWINKKYLVGLFAMVTNR